jgi:hypothetical protein
MLATGAWPRSLRISNVPTRLDSCATPWRQHRHVLAGEQE